MLTFEKLAILMMLRASWTISLRKFDRAIAEIKEMSGIDDAFAENIYIAARFGNWWKYSG